jgi:hypothetical protein
MVDPDGEESARAGVSTQSRIVSAEIFWIASSQGLLAMTKRSAIGRCGA